MGLTRISPDDCYFPLWALRAGPLGPRLRLQGSLMLAYPRSLYKNVFLHVVESRKARARNEAI